MSFQSINRTIGYSLLIVGMLLIVIPLFQVYNIFINKAGAPEIIKTQQSRLNENVGALDMQKQVENALIKIIPIDPVIKTINLIIWFILLAIFMFGGKQIASIGIMLLKIPS